MKKCFVITLPILIFVLYSGCDMHSGKRPPDYHSTIWVSEDPEMWFEIGKFNEWGAYTSPEKIFGYLILDGQNIEIEVFFDRGSGVYFNPTSDFDKVTRGRCTFGPDKLVVNIDKERDNFLNGRWEIITFYRISEKLLEIINKNRVMSTN